MKKGLIGDAITWFVVTIGIVFSLMIAILIIQFYPLPGTKINIAESGIYSGFELLYFLDGRVEGIKVRELLRNFTENENLLKNYTANYIIENIAEISEEERERGCPRYGVVVIKIDLPWKIVFGVRQRYEASFHKWVADESSLKKKPSLEFNRFRTSKGDVFIFDRFDDKSFFRGYDFRVRNCPSSKGENSWYGWKNLSLSYKKPVLIGIRKKKEIF